MPLITRVARLFRSDMHAVLDRIEDPALLLRQAVREMHEAVMEEERHSGLLGQELGQLKVRRQDLQGVYARVDEELDICFRSGKPDLARALVKRRLETDRLCQFLDRRREQLARDLEGLESRLAQNRSRLEDMQQKLAILAGPDQADGAVAHDPLDTGLRIGAVTSEDIEVAFLREQQKRVQP